MAVIFQYEALPAIGLIEFIRQVNAIYTGPHQLEPQMIGRLAQLLGKLAADKHWLTDHLCDVLEHEFAGQSAGNSYGNDALVIYSQQEPFFQIRVCFWHPRQAVKQAQEKYDVYQCLHDHNFGFLTTNYYGPGYVSRFYRYQYQDDLMCGSPVPLALQFEHQLSPGQIVWYEPSVDVHLQHPPQAFSVSLNLIFETNENKQFVFDASNQRVDQVVYSSHQLALQFCRQFLQTFTV
ncbi:hypothetical protein [Rheinheimera texasensis]|jgi:hypothetical protein|uniref:hypothetical protein n=1 Tax=Rheinheimera texasensis TaxID=306205 RepID=UPI0004E28721|nr:hypothetical protein [Rheinheimera texasensis]